MSSRPLKVLVIVPGGRSDACLPHYAVYLTLNPSPSDYSLGHLCCIPIIQLQLASRRKVAQGLFGSVRLL